MATVGWALGIGHLQHLVQSLSIVRQQPLPQTRAKIRLSGAVPLLRCALMAWTEMG
jgi:hypothetical protein